MKLRIIGDVHGHFPEYINLAKEAEFSIQLGDLGFDYAPMVNLDPEKHRVIGGNHDNYTSIDDKFVKQPPHFLGDYGVHTVPGFGEFFYVRGGRSIDQASRIEGISWWQEEQISYSKALDAIEQYEEIKPDRVLSHECPASVIDSLAGFKTWDGEPILPSMTARMLERMFFLHKPKLWLFGHHHKAFDATIEGTRFVCLPELGFLDFEGQ
jgi:predicted phosphodiesterase